MRYFYPHSSGKLKNDSVHIHSSLSSSRKINNYLWLYAKKVFLSVSDDDKDGLRDYIEVGGQLIIKEVLHS